MLGMDPLSALRLLALLGLVLLVVTAALLGRRLYGTTGAGIMIGTLALVGLNPLGPGIAAARRDTTDRANPPARLRSQEATGWALAKQAETSGRPVAVDLDEHAAYLGISAAQRAKALASLEAPDFTLPDLDGRPHSLSAQRGKKVLLVAYASW